MGEARIKRYTICIAGKMNSVTAGRITHLPISYTQITMLNMRQRWFGILLLLRQRLFLLLRQGVCNTMRQTAHLHKQQGKYQQQSAGQ